MLLSNFTKYDQSRGCNGIDASVLSHILFVNTSRPKWDFPVLKTWSMQLWKLSKYSRELHVSLNNSYWQLGQWTAQRGHLRVWALRLTGIYLLNVVVLRAEACYSIGHVWRGFCLSVQRHFPSPPGALLRCAMSWLYSSQCLAQWDEYDIFISLVCMKCYWELCSFAQFA